MSGVSKGKSYSFMSKEGLKIGIFEGKVISYNPYTIVQIRDITDENILYNVKMELLKEVGTSEELKAIVDNYER